MMEMLNDLSELKKTSFGKPDPGHGLRLLWSFARDCVNISDGKMTAKCDPRTGQFGFKRFNNNNEGHKINAGKLLPNRKWYFEVGNLNEILLPSYIASSDNTKKQHKCNKDRIIVLYDTFLKTFKVIYVTQHLSQKGKRKQFDQHQTYCISPDLIKLIQDLKLKDILHKTMDNEESDFLSQEELSDDEDRCPLLQTSKSPHSSSEESLNRGQPQQQTPKSPKRRPTLTNMAKEKSCRDCCCIL